MKPLTPQTVYVSTYEKLLFTPREDVRAIIEETKESVVVNKPSGVTDVIFNWQSVKEQSLYCFSKEELVEFVKSNFSAGVFHERQPKLEMDEHQYIKELFSHAK